MESCPPVVAGWYEDDVKEDGDLPIGWFEDGDEE